MNETQSAILIGYRIDAPEVEDPDPAEEIAITDRMNRLQEGEKLSPTGLELGPETLLTLDQILELPFPEKTCQMIPVTIIWSIDRHDLEVLGDALDLASKI